MLIAENSVKLPRAHDKVLFFFVEGIKNSLRKAKGNLGHVAHIHLCTHHHMSKVARTPSSS